MILLKLFDYELYKRAMIHRNGLSSDFSRYHQQFFQRNLEDNFGTEYKNDRMNQRNDEGIERKEGII